MKPFKNYKKPALQPMRPYVQGEDLTGVSVSEQDTPEVGGMIAINPQNEKDQWYVAKAFFESNYELAEPPLTSFEDRLKVEQSELREKLDKLSAFIGTEPFNNLEGVDQALLQLQSDHMLAYLGVLVHRISIL